MEQYKDYGQQPIILKNVAVYLMKKWYTLVIAGIVFTLAGCGLAYLNVRNREEKESDVYALYVEERNNIVHSIEMAEEKIEEREQYVNKSIIMNIDSGNKPVVSLNVLIDVSGAEEGYNESAEKIVSYYIDVLGNKELYEEISQELNLENSEAYVRELVTINETEQKFMFNIQTTYLDMTSAEKVMDIILEYIREHTGEVVGLTDSHTLEMTERSSRYVVDVELQNQQQYEFDAIYYLRQDKKELERILEELEVPSSALTMSPPIFGVLGIIVMIIIWMLIYLFNGKLHSKEEIEKEFQLFILGDWKDMDVSFEETLSIIKSRISGRLEEKKVLFLTTLPEEKYSSFKEEILSELKENNIESEFISGIHMSSCEIDVLNNYRQVVILERAGVTVYSEMAKEIHDVSKMGKEIVGCIC